MAHETGTILDFRGSWGSGIATLTVEDSKGQKRTIQCENAPTVRALDAIFGDVITPSHRVDVEKIIGRKIRYSVDDLGILTGIAPEEE